MSGQFTKEYLAELQGYPLSVKLSLTKQRIREWINKFGEDGVYVSFSGGKDSTVLLHIVREMYPNIPAVFVDTGLEYPEIRQFVRGFDNVTWLKPKKNFRKVIEDYGYPFISKEVSECVWAAKKYLTEVLQELGSDRQTDRQTDGISGTARSTVSYVDLVSMRNPTRGGGTQSIENSEDFLNILKRDRGKKSTYRLARLMGMLTTDTKYQTAKNIPSQNRSMFAQTKYKFFLEPDAPIISNKCCAVMKKNPVHKYSRDTGRVPMTAEMASESKIRTQKWIQNGCNGFSMNNPKSTPMAFWTEQDVLLYIYQNQISIASVYGEVIKENEVDGQLDFADIGLFDLGRPILKTTGCKRTGCMFCGYGCHLEPEGEGRFERLKITHPKIYDYIMRPWEDGGLNYKKVIDWINEHGNLHIRY